MDHIILNRAHEESLSTVDKLVLALHVILVHFFPFLLQIQGRFNKNIELRPSSCTTRTTLIMYDKSKHSLGYFLGLWDPATFGYLLPALGLWSVITCNVNYAIDNCKEGNGIQTYS